MAVQWLDDLEPIVLEPNSDIGPNTRDTMLYFMNLTEELCGRTPKLLDWAWAQAMEQRVREAVSNPVMLLHPEPSGSSTGSSSNSGASSSGSSGAAAAAAATAGATAVHLLDVTHDDFANPALLAAVWRQLAALQQPVEAVALDVQPPYIKSFTRMAKAMPPGLMDKLLSAPLASLSGALNHGDDFDRLRWHHAILSVSSSGGSPIDIDEATLVNAFANRDLHLSEPIAAAALAAAAAGPGSSNVMVHGVDVEDDAMLTALDEDGFWTDADTADYRKRLLGAAEPQLRAAVNTWLQGIPTGTSATVPRQRFVLTRLESALTPAQQQAFQAADAEWRRGHREPRVREHQALREQQAAHMAARIAEVAAGRIGGRRCGRVLAVLGGGHAARVRALLQAQQAQQGQKAQAQQ
ncbi:hypothetical protein HYH02_010991 [Chlamydomonas schloesseri]|uniref:Uncharacterized protein n=1 Tax=Chlamydomonas schloesseri TaxID=2026947 RepID=A0A835T3R6_9CHLO|nr:hypothetical protein HYH02_010991 [Chlamydomonas schloesseri]|eukprot:KAG2438294.1 hypothetical protein HYH02_010991 [Chlamydomonas schloesseri]